MRADLLALGPEALAALANPGLVKRAAKENLASPPVVEEDGDGVVVGSFADGTVARLPPGTSLRDAPCTCGAVTVCRHRIAVVLQYAATAAAPSAAPAGLDDAALVRFFGEKRVAAARLARERLGAVEVAFETVPTVRFATCTVRLLAGDDLAHARCDCADDRCAHVIVAVWALRDGPSASPRPASDADVEALQPAVAQIERLLLDGMAHGAGHAPALARLADGFAADRRAWPAAILAELVAQLHGYAERHARHDPAVAAGLCTELLARARAIAGGAPAEVVLGAGIAAETPLDTVRLVGLGARVEHDGERLSVEVYLADPDAGVTLVLPLGWTPEPGEQPAERRIATGISLGRLAAGQVVSKKATRRPDREVRLAGGRATSLLAQTGDWGALPAALRVDRLADWAERRRREPPRLVGARVRARDLVVLRVRAVDRMRWAPGAQELRAVLHDAVDRPLDLVVPWRSAAPNAVDAAAAALPRATWVAGVLGADRRLVPTAIVAGEVIVPDLAGASPPARLPLDGPARPTPLAHALRAAEDRLASAAHHGLLARDPDTREAVARLEGLGLAGLADALRRWEAAARAGSPDVVAAWATAAVHVALALERLHVGEP